MKKILISLIQKNKFVDKLVYFLYHYIFLLIFSIFKIDNKKIVVISYYGKGYWDMGKYICNELFKHDYKIYWATKEDYKDSLPKQIKYVEYNSIKYLYHLATAKIWINNSRFPYWVRKRKKQFYIQTRHGCFAFKKVEAAAEKVLPKYYILGAKNDSKIADLFVSNSTFCTNFYKNYFWYNGDILEYGCPRNDIIINNNKDIIKKVREYFWFSNSEKICLYAPTFRVNSSLDVYNIDYKELIKELVKKFKCNWKLLIKLHPNISHLSNQLLGLNKNIINATNYPDMQELLVAADFMITDYSSCIFDYALSKKPAIIYASDIKEYIKDRDFEIKLNDAPFSIATDNIELKKIIDNFDTEKYEKKLNKFYDDMWLKETGKSCKKIVEIINEISRDKRFYLN